jgi:hypothetical protein
MYATTTTTTTRPLSQDDKADRSDDSKSSATHVGIVPVNDRNDPFYSEKASSKEPVVRDGNGGGSYDTQRVAKKPIVGGERVEYVPADRSDAKNGPLVRQESAGRGKVRAESGSRAALAAGAVGTSSAVSGHTKIFSKAPATVTQPPPQSDASRNVRNSNRKDGDASSSETRRGKTSNHEPPPGDTNWDELLSANNTTPGRVGFDEHFQNSSEVMARMEMLYDKLILLRISLDDPGMRIEHRTKENSNRGRLLPFHFAVNLQMFENVAGHGKGFQFFQFKRMVGLVILLCNRIGGSVAVNANKLVAENDAPVQIAKQLLKLVEVPFLTSLVISM